MGSAGPDMTQDARQVLGLSLVTPLYFVNMHSSVLEVDAVQAGSGGTPVHLGNVMLPAALERKIVMRKLY